MILGQKLPNLRTPCDQSYGQIELPERGMQYIPDVLIRGWGQADHVHQCLMTFIALREWTRRTMTVRKIWIALPWFSNGKNRLLFVFIYVTANLSQLSVNPALLGPLF